LNAQTAIEAIETCTDPHIKTILLYRTGWDLSMPVIYMDENEKLNLDFDYLDTLAGNYSYSVINCTYDWKINDMGEHDYLVGFNDVPINEVSQSLNTTRSFTHFSATFPNEDLRIVKSGNYLVRVYRNGEPDKVLFTRRFCIAERLININAQVKRPDNENQELRLEIDFGNLQLENPLNELKVLVIKNYDWNSKIDIATSPLLRDNTLNFDMPYQIMSPGGNEFRYFDIKSVKFISERVGHIDFQNPNYHVFLKPDEAKQFKPYLTSKDLNGRYYIDASDARNRYEEADYVYVHFILNASQPFGSDVYIYGALTNYRTDESNFMTYNIEKSAYEKTLLLKQGYYNYAYATRDFNKKKIDFDLTEGIHAETENDYAVFVYLKRAMSDFDRLVGFKIINSTGEAK
jgi:hypothetical protein